MVKEKAIKGGLTCLLALGMLAGISWAMGKKPAKSEGSAVMSEEKIEVEKAPEIAEITTETIEEIEIQKQAQVQWVEWSFTGDKIIYVTINNRNEGELWMMDLKSKKKKHLIKGYLHRYFKPYWSPDGKKIVCSIAESLYKGSDIEMLSDYLSIWNIWIIDVEKGTKTRLSLDNKHSHINPIWSPDGKKIVYSSTGNCSYKVKMKSGQEKMKLAYGLHIVHNDGSNKKILTVPRAHLWRDIPLAWSSDGKRIIYFAGGFERLDIGIYSFDINTQEKKQIVKSWDYDIHLEKERIVYVSPKDKNIWITDFEGSYKRQITSTPTVEKGEVQWISSQEIAGKFWEIDSNGDGKINRDDVYTMKVINYETGDTKILKKGIKKIKKSSKTDKIVIIKDNKILLTDSFSNLIVR